MLTTIYRGNRQPIEISIPHEWSDFWFCVKFGFLFLFVAAILAKVKISSFPANPLYWHLWIIANAEKQPLLSENSPPRIYRPYMYFWGASICFLTLAFGILVSILDGY